jgi:hypothetical protein
MTLVIITLPQLSITAEDIELLPFGGEEDVTDVVYTIEFIDISHEDLAYFKGLLRLDERRDGIDVGMGNRGDTTGFQGFNTVGDSLNVIQSHGGIPF